MQLLDTEVLLHSIHDGAKGRIGLAQHYQTTDSLQRVLRGGNDGSARPHITQTLRDPVIYTSNGGITCRMGGVHSNVVLDTPTAKVPIDFAYCITIRGTRCVGSIFLIPLKMMGW